MLFYVNVFDIDNLGTMQEYVACTSEKIFEEKTKLWDVYVNNQNIRATTRASYLDHA